MKLFKALPSFKSYGPYHSKPCTFVTPLLSPVVTIHLYQSIMYCLLSAVALFLPILPSLISAQCAACDSYTAALKSCQTTSAKVNVIGTTMDSTTLHCMCTTKSNVTQMNACQGCEESSPNASLDIILLSVWTATCAADGQFGDQQALLCWESQPDNFLPCLSKTSGGGSGSGNVGGGTTGGGDVASTSAVAGATSSSPR